MMEGIVETLSNIEEETSLKEVQHVLGFAKFFQQLIKDCSNYPPNNLQYIIGYAGLVIHHGDQSSVETTYPCIHLYTDPTML